MQVEYSYKSSSAVVDRLDRTSMSFSPDLKRQPTFFSGELRKSLEFREAISAMHSVVTMDLRYKPKDRTEYKAWAEGRFDLDWALVEGQRNDVTKRIEEIKLELTELQRARTMRLQPFLTARSAFRSYVFRTGDPALFLFDPVITVHPDEVFFECFSKDESAYARLGANFDVFQNVGEFSCGTTNVDYSSALYDEFQKIRTYKNTRFEVDPSGFEVQTTGTDAHKEVKIDLPDSWVRGFLQVNSAMSLPATVVTLDPMDIHNLCFVLRRHREQTGPRSIRFHLEPGRPVRMVVEPWGYVVECPRSIYDGRHAEEIRVWGRRRLLTLERLIPLARAFTVHLLGTGMPSFYVADLGDMSYTLGLSGWTANDWASQANFDLLAPRAEVDEPTMRRVFDALGDALYETPDALAAKLRLDRAMVLGALGGWTQAGRAMFDLNKRVYRKRELSRDPLPMETLRFSNPREERATQIVAAGRVNITETAIDAHTNFTLLGTVKDRERQFDVTLTTDPDERILRAACSCNWHQQNKLFKGPCEHILALRMRHRRRGI